jgi:rod shape-determining protein MreD
MRGCLVLFLTLYLLRALLAELNTELSGLHVWIFAGGLYVAFSALAMPFRIGFAASVLGGLLCDAMKPVAMGTHAALFGAAHAAVFNLRERLQRDEVAVRVVVVLVLNLVLFLSLSLVRGHFGALPRMLSDLAWSEAFVAVAAPWFTALQIRSLELAGASPERLA